MRPKLIMLRVFANHAHQGQRFSRLVLPPDCHGLGIIRNNQLLTMAEDPLIQVGDRLLAVAVNGAWEVELQARLNETDALHCLSTLTPDIYSRPRYYG